MDREPAEASGNMMLAPSERDVITVLRGVGPPKMSSANCPLRATVHGERRAASGERRAPWLGRGCRTGRRHPLAPRLEDDHSPVDSPIVQSLTSPRS
jgi:hypothetical protein